MCFFTIIGFFVRFFFKNFYPFEINKKVNTKYSPFGENATLNTELECSVRVLMCYPFYTLYTPIFYPMIPNTLRLAKILNFKHSMAYKVLMISPLETLQTFDCLITRSRRQILSIRRKDYTLKWTRMSGKCPYTLSSRKPPYTDRSVLRSRGQILSVRKK